VPHHPSPPLFPYTTLFRSCSDTSNSISAPFRSSSSRRAAASSAKSRRVWCSSRLRIRGRFRRSRVRSCEAELGGGGGGGGLALAALQPLTAVAAHVLDQREQRLTLDRERVLHPRRHLGE